MSDCLANTTIETPEPANQTEIQAVRPRHTVRPLDGAYEVGIVLPGVKRDAISVRLDDGVLTVEGRRDDVDYSGMKALQREIPPVRFHLELEVHVPVDAAGISARFEDGVLTLRLPLKDEAKVREIPVE